MSLSDRIFAAAYDRMLAGPEKAGIRAHREQLLAGARGRVLEIGAGTGASLPYYPSGVEQLVATEPSPAMASRLERRVHEQGVDASVVNAPSEELPFADESFDTAVSTLVLCTVDDLERALAELRRVLKPDGQLLFIEHVRSEEPGLARWQDRLNWIQRIVGHGCNCNRPTLERIRAAGFTVKDLQRDRLKKAPPIVRPLIVGRAAAS